MPQFSLPEIPKLTITSVIDILAVGVAMRLEQRGVAPLQHLAAAGTEQAQPDAAPAPEPPRRVGPRIANSGRLARLTSHSR